MAYKVSGNTIITDSREAKFYGDTIFASRSFNQYNTVGAKNAAYVVQGDNVPGSASDLKETFPFTNDTNITCIGQLAFGFNSGAAISGTTYGYIVGGDSPAFPINPGATSDTICKFPFAADNSKFDVGNLNGGRHFITGNYSQYNGYASGGINRRYDFPCSQIDKFPFASDTDAAWITTLCGCAYSGAGLNSSTHGYVASGIKVFPGTTYLTSTDKFPFAIEITRSLISNISPAQSSSAGNSSEENGYISGGKADSTTVLNSITRFPFASEASSTDVGDLTTAKLNVTSSSGIETGYGYLISGVTPTSPSTVRSDVIEKFPFSVDVNATDVGDLNDGTCCKLGYQG